MPQKFLCIFGNSGATRTKRFKGDMQRFFHKIDEKVVSSYLLQYKPVCVTNFNKLRRKMLKKKFSCLFSIAILRKSSSYVTSYQEAHVSFAFR